jgi:hypothetical protein
LSAIPDKQFLVPASFEVSLHDPRYSSGSVKEGIEDRFAVGGPRCLVAVHQDQECHLTRLSIDSVNPLATLTIPASGKK